MPADGSSVAEHFRSEKVAHIDAGSRGVSNPEMFYWLNGGLTEGYNGEKWSQPIPDALTRVEGEYYALVKSLQAAVDKGYLKVIVATNSEQILDQLLRGEPPSPKERPFYVRAYGLREQFVDADLILFDS